MSLTARDLSDTGEKGVKTERLGQTAGRVDLAGTRPRVARGRHDDDWRVRARRLVIAARKLPAIHQRHEHVQEDHVGPRRAKEVQRSGAIGGLHHVVACIRQGRVRDVTDALVVVKDQDAYRPTHGDPPLQLDCLKVIPYYSKT